jgi:hypothetical protein
MKNITKVRQYWEFLEYESYYQFTQYSQRNMKGVFMTSHGTGSSTVFDFFGLTQILVKPKKG